MRKNNWMENSWINIFFEEIDNEETDKLEDIEEGEEFDIDNYADGESFFYNNIEFVRLGEEQGGVLAITAKIWKQAPIQNKGTDITDWLHSDLRNDLNHSILSNLLDTTTMIEEETGVSCRVSLLNCDQWAKYRSLLPKYSNWIWLRNRSYNNPNYFHVDHSKGLVSFNCANIHIGCAPIVLFRKKALS